MDKVVEYFAIHIPHIVGFHLSVNTARHEL